MMGKRCVLPREVSHGISSRDGENRAGERVVTTNCEKSAEAIVGGNAEGPNEIQFANFIIVCWSLQTVCVHPTWTVRAGDRTSEGKEETEHVYEVNRRNPK